jgi:hypothetical protein
MSDFLDDIALIKTLEGSGIPVLKVKNPPGFTR